MNYPAEWDKTNFDELYQRYVAGELDAHAFTAFHCNLRKMRRESTCPVIRWPSLAIWALVTIEEMNEQSLNSIERLHRDGLLPDDSLEDYRQLWRRASPRFSDVCAQYDHGDVRPNVKGPLAASVVARFFSYAAHDTLYGLRRE
jgi:hypothetical protein